MVRRPFVRCPDARRGCRVVATRTGGGRHGGTQTRDDGCAPDPGHRHDATAAAPRPNVVFILTDDQRWDTIDKKHSVDGITPVMPKVQSLLVSRNSTTSTATRSSSPTSPATRRTPG